MALTLAFGQDGLDGGILFCRDRVVGGIRERQIGERPQDGIGKQQPAREIGGSNTSMIVSGA